MLKIPQINKARNGFPGNQPIVGEYYSKDNYLISVKCVKSASPLVVFNLYYLEQTPQYWKKKKINYLNSSTVIDVYTLAC